MTSLDVQYANAMMVCRIIVRSLDSAPPLPQPTNTLEKHSVDKWTDVPTIIKFRPNMHTYIHIYVYNACAHCFDPLIVCGGQTRANLLRVKFPIDAFRVSSNKNKSGKILQKEGGREEGY